MSRAQPGETLHGGETVNGLETQPPSAELETQIREDERLKWVVRMDRKDQFVKAVGSALSVLPIAFFLGFFGAVGALIATGGGQRNAVLGFAAVLVGLPLLTLVVGIVGASLRTYEYAATDERFIKQVDSPFGLSSQSIQIDNVRDAELSRGLVDKLLGNGDVRIEGELGNDTISFDNVPNSDEVLRAVREEASF